MSIRNIEELRNFMAVELERVRIGDSTPASANAVANVAGKMLGSIKMELEYNKMTGTSPSIAFLKSSETKEINRAKRN